MINNKATVFSEQLDPPVPVTAEDNLTISEKVDLSVEKQDFPDPAAIGGPLRYQVLVSNAGPSDAFNVVLTDTLPVSVTFGTATFGCVHDGSATGGNVVCTFPTIAANDSKVVQIDVTVLSALIQDRDIITNIAVVTSDSAEDAADLGNNTDSEDTEVRFGTDLSIAKFGPKVVLSGGTLTYTLLARNLGPATAYTVTVTDTLPSAMITNTVSFTTSNGTVCTQTDAVIECPLVRGNTPMLIGEQVIITVTGQVAPGTALGSTLSNVANIGTETFDFNSQNDEAQYDTLVVGISDLGIAKSGPATATAGLDIITYTLVISNAGTVPGPAGAGGGSPARWVDLSCGRPRPRAPVPRVWPVSSARWMSSTPLTRPRW